MASSTQLHSAYSKLDAASSSDPSFSATVMQLVALVQTWQPASRDAQSMQFAGQVMDLLDAKGMIVLRNTPQLGQGVLVLQHLMRMTERLPSGAMIPNFERIDYTRMRTLNTQGTFAVSAYTCNDGSALALKFDTSNNKIPRPGDQAPIVNPRTLRREAVMLRWLSDARIIRSYGSICQVFSDQPKGLPMLVLPLVPNGNLRKFLINNPNGPRIPLLRDVASGIQYLFRVGILHCDLKSMNIMVDANQRAVLIDFGNSVVIQAPERQSAWGKMSTLAWQAPEIHGQVFDGQVPRILHTISSEVWSFGVVMFEVLTGHLPYRSADGHNKAAWMIEAGQKPWNPEDAINFARPDFALMQHCLEHSPEHRPQIDQVVQHLAGM